MMLHSDDGRKIDHRSKKKKGVVAADSNSNTKRPSTKRQR